MKRFDVTTVGEALLRLSVPAGTRLETAATLDVHPAGTEANVVSLLSRLGRRCSWTSALPRHALGRVATREMRLAGVDLSQVVWTDSGRVGTYYVEFGSLPRPTEVIYDRVGSSAAHLAPADMTWDQLLNTRLLHLTGITPALSPSCREVVAEAVRRAIEAGVPISFDVNYRQKLWSTQEAGDTLLELVQGVSLLLCSADDARLLFGCGGEPRVAIEQLMKVTRAQRVVLTLGDRGVLAGDGSRWYRQGAPAVTILDRIGAGDALAAGVIHGWLQDDFRAGLQYGTLLAALALGQHGDTVVTTAEELERLLERDGPDIAR
jgi:2-dehydro-3-deoxygluconokinase